MQKFIATGNMGSDPELRTFGDNKQVASFSFATSESYKNKQGEKVTNTEWHQCSVFGGLCKVVENYIKKGSKLFIEGKIKYDTYEKDGVKKYSTKIIVQNLEMLDSKGSNTEQKEKPVNTSQNESFEDNGDLPF